MDKTLAGTSRREWCIFVVYAVCLGILGHSLFLGGNQLLLQDGAVNFEQDLPLYQWIVTGLREGSFSSYSTTLGFGASILNWQMVVLDIFAIPVYLVGYFAGPQMVAPAIVWSQVARMLFSAITCYYFLDSIRLSGTTKRIGALCYAFIGCLPGALGQHYALASAAVFFPLMVAYIFRSRQQKNSFIWLTIIVALTFVWSLGHGVVMVILCGLLGIVLSIKDAKTKRVRSVFWLGLLVLSLAAGMCLSGGAIVPIIKTIQAGMGGLPGEIGLLEAAIRFIYHTVSWQGAIFVIALFQIGIVGVLVNQSLQLRLFNARIVWAIVGACVVAFLCINFWLSIVPWLAAIIVVVGVILCTALLQILKYTEVEDAVRSRKRWLVFVTVASVLCAYCLTIKGQPYLLSNDMYGEYKANDSAMAKAHARQELFSDSAFLRMDKARHGYGPQQNYNYAMVEGYRGASYASSYSHEGLLNYRNEMLQARWLSPDQASYSFAQMGTVLDNVVADILGIGFVITDYKTDNPAWALVEDMEKNGYLYQNINMDSAGLLYNQWIDMQEYGMLSKAEKQALSAHTVLLEGGIPQEVQQRANIPMEVVTEGLDWDNTIVLTGQASLRENNSMSITVQEEGAEVQIPIDTSAILKVDCQAFVQFSANTDYDCTFSIHCDTGFGVEDSYWAMQEYALSANQPTEIAYKLPADTQTLVIRCADPSTLDFKNVQIQVSNGHTYNTQGVTLDNPGKAGYLSGHIQTDENALVLLPIPYDSSWEISLNGAVIPYYRANHAFIAVEVSQGSSVLEAQYYTLGKKTGWILSSLGGLGLMLVVLFERRRVIYVS